MGKIKTFIILLLILILAGAGVAGYLEFKYDVFGLKQEEELKIDKTPLVIEETKKISELTSAHFYEEVVVKKNRTDKGIIFDSKNELVVIAKGNVRAGFNLSKLTENDITIQNDTINVNLPAAEIFDVIVNPSDYEVFVSDGKWSHDETSKAVTEAQAKIKQDAIDNGILTTASTSGVNKLTELFKSFGFNVVNIKVPNSVDYSAVNKKD